LAVSLLADAFLANGACPRCTRAPVFERALCKVFFILRMTENFITQSEV
jgi:hypothetical protein